jgi:hypothetical protein
MGVATFIKVCDLDDLPPGTGRVIRVGAREVYVYNREGRVFAAACDHKTAHMPPLGEPPHMGASFEVEQEDSPVRMCAHAGAVAVELRADGIYVALDEAGSPAMVEQPVRAF